MQPLGIHYTRLYLENPKGSKNKDTPARNLWGFLKFKEETSKETEMDISEGMGKNKYIVNWVGKLQTLLSVRLIFFPHSTKEKKMKI